MERRTFAKIIAASGAALAGFPAIAQTATQEKHSMKTEDLSLVQEWDKTFKLSDKVTHSKVTFPNRFGITLAADLYIPKGASGKLPA
ncbi:MAG: hypothetical protein IK051_02650, partial [Rhodocyclaceae bacterium]|nr:hypothetical protein [Rhodocyclaceae bacterium]